MTVHPRANRARLAAGLGLLFFLLAACSSGSGATTGPVSVAPSQVAGGSSIAVSAATGSVGAYLTGPSGMTLYTLKTDSAGTTTCTDTCAQSWPPFTVATGDTFQPGAGVTGALASFQRPDGTMQVTDAGMPLYYFAGDKAAGDTNGQGVGGKWFVASPAGFAAPASAAPASAAPSSGGGYGGY